MDISTAMVLTTIINAGIEICKQAGATDAEIKAHLEQEAKKFEANNPHDLPDVE